MILRQSLIAFSVAVTLAGCAASDPHRRAKTGAAIGAVAGAVLGHQIDDEEGKFLGAAVGAMTGAVVGDYMDKQERAFEETLAEEQRQNEIEIERMKDETLKLSLSNEISFDFGSADIKPAFEPTLAKLTDVLKNYNRTTVQVVGHTDSVGSETYNQQLSERRAQAVADYLASHGVPSARLSSEGRGEREPRDTNDTEAGRSLNRRVEIYVKPILEGEQQAARGPHNQHL